MRLISTCDCPGSTPKNGCFPAWFLVSYIFTKTLQSESFNSRSSNICSVEIESDSQRWKLCAKKSQAADPRVEADRMDLYWCHAVVKTETHSALFATESTLFI